jgi:methionyl-tRNA formyltransferase
LTPWPGTFTFWHNRRLKILEAAPALDWQGSAPPGAVIDVETGAAVATGEGALRLERVQLAGKRAMEIGPFLRGQRGFVGSRLGLD